MLPHCTTSTPEPPTALLPRSRPRRTAIEPASDPHNPASWLLGADRAHAAGYHSRPARLSRHGSYEPPLSNSLRPCSTLSLSLNLQPPLSPLPLIQPPLSLSLSHTHTHTPTRTRKHAHARALSLASCLFAHHSRCLTRSLFPRRIPPPRPTPHAPRPASFMARHGVARRLAHGNGRPAPLSRWQGAFGYLLGLLHRAKTKVRLSESHGTGQGLKRGVSASMTVKQPNQIMNTMSPKSSKRSMRSNKPI